MNKSWILNGKRVPLCDPIPEKVNDDPVNSPSHYVDGRQYEPIKVIQDWELDFCLGNTVKYISRAGRKSSSAMDQIDKTIQDLDKARFYLNFKIAELNQIKKKLQNTDGYQE